MAEATDPSRCRQWQPNEAWQYFIQLDNKVECTLCRMRQANCGSTSTIIYKTVALQEQKDSTKRQRKMFVASKRSCDSKRLEQKKRFGD